MQVFEVSAFVWGMGVAAVDPTWYHRVAFGQLYLEF